LRFYAIFFQDEITLYLEKYADIVSVISDGDLFVTVLEEGSEAAGSPAAFFVVMHLEWIKETGM